TDRAENCIYAKRLPSGIDQHLAHQCGLARDDEGVVKWVQKCTFLLLGDLTRTFTRDFLAVAFSVLREYHAGACALRELDLALWSIVGHDDCDWDARSMSCKGKRLREIARREGDYT